jgi:hypothetical protein
MNEPTQGPSGPAAEGADRERTKQVLAVAIATCILTFMALWALVFKPTWPMAVGVCAVTSMSAVISFAALRRR